MGLLINATEDKKILITGTAIELPSVYVRLEYSARQNGVTLEIAALTYDSLATYEAGGSSLLTDVPQSNIVVELVEGQMQDLSSAEFYSKASYEELGYIVVVI